MLKELEYLGFAMKTPEDGMVINVFDVVDDGIKRYGPYKWHEKSESKVSLDTAEVITIAFEDGTMPISIEEFDERVHAGETWINQQYNIFTRLKTIGSAFLMSRKLGKKVDLYRVLEEEEQAFYLTMFDQCMDCFMNVDRKGRRKMSKAERSFDENVPNFQQFFVDQDVHQMCREAILEMMDEAQQTVDAALVNFILKEQAALVRKKVAPEKRAAAIVRAVKKRYRDRNKEEG